MPGAADVMPCLNVGTSLLAVVVIPQQAGRHERYHSVVVARDVYGSRTNASSPGLQIPLTPVPTVVYETNTSCSDLSITWVAFDVDERCESDVRYGWRLCGIRYRPHACPCTHERSPPMYPWIFIATYQSATLCTCAHACG